jgi:uncharacterized damage-inducible protein DinB
MLNPQDLVSRMQDFCGFVARLGVVQPEVLLAPMAEGKWSVQEAIAHIMAYDESFLQSAVLPIEDGRQPHIADEADNQSFNERAAALGRKLTKAQLIERATHARRQLVDHLRRLPVEAFRATREGPCDGDLAELLYRDFVTHDRSHIEQIQRYLKSRGYHDVAYGAQPSPAAGRDG